MISWVPKKIINKHEIEKYILLSTESNIFTNNGPVVKKLSKFIKKEFNIDQEKSIICVSNATIGLHVLASAVMIHKKKTKNFNWVTQSFTFPPSAQGILKDAKIIDIDSSGGLDLSLISSSETDGIIVTNIFGNVVDIDKYVNWCKENDVVLLFDNAATPNTIYKGKNALDYGTGCVISFHHTKPFGFGEGGAIIVDSYLEPIIQRLINFGFHPIREMKWNSLATNGKMSDISAAYILQYIQNYKNIIYHHKMLYKHMLDILPQEMQLYPNFSSGLPFASCFCILIKNGYDIKIRLELEKNGVVCRKYYKPLLDTPVATDIFEKIICVPCTIDMNINDIDNIIRIMSSIK